jgi:hypothetical protein
VTFWLGVHAKGILEDVNSGPELPHGVHYEIMDLGSVSRANRFGSAVLVSFPQDRDHVSTSAQSSSDSTVPAVEPADPEKSTHVVEGVDYVARVNTATRHRWSVRYSF